VGQAVRMAREIPEVVRAAAGLAAIAVDEARKLPQTLPGLPVRLIGLAMQQAMKVQQQYAGLVARGDELFTGVRGEDEPGLATFDDEAEPVVPPPGFRDSAFDRAAATSARDAATYPVADPQDDEIPATHEILDELAIDEMVGDAPGPADSLDATDPVDTADPVDATDPVATADTLDTEAAADVPTAVDVLTPGGEVTTVDATVTDEGIAAPEGASEDTTAPGTDTVPGTDTATATEEGGAPVAAATGVRTDVGGPDTSAEDAAIAEGAAVDTVGGESAAPTDDPEGGSELSGSQAAGTAPIDGYDSFSIAQLRGRLRGYALSTVQDLLEYEQATRAREPYLKMLRNRLEKLEEQAVASSPLAPRGS
jgi:hypothetical protein